MADLSRHFEIEVPQRALKHLILRYTIFAFSSRHLSRFNNYEETEAMQYHDKCLQLLIPIVSDSGQGVDEEVFASIAILRQYEEMDGRLRAFFPPYLMFYLLKDVILYFACINISS